MTKLSKPTPAEMNAVETAELLVAQRADELAIIEGDIASAEADLPELAGSEDDSAFETASLGIERLRRKELRATKRLEAARAELAEAEAGEKEDRRKARYEAGANAVAEIETLTAKYTEHAGAIVEILREINSRAKVIEVANNNRADYAPWFEAPQLGLSVRLPIGGGEYGWLWPEAAERRAESRNADAVRTPARAEGSAAVRRSHTPRRLTRNQITACRMAAAPRVGAGIRNHNIETDKFPRRPSPQRLLRRRREYSRHNLE
jgi:hypothetical protein